MTVQETLDMFGELGFLELPGDGNINVISPQINLHQLRMNHFMKFITDCVKTQNRLKYKCFFTLYDAWREHSEPSARPVFVNLDRKIMQAYSGTGTLGEKGRFIHPHHLPNIFPVFEYPVVAFGRHLNDPFVQLVPDSDFISSNGYERLRYEIDSVDCLWSQKKQQLFWRGSMHGFPYRRYDQEGRKTQRELLIEWSMQNHQISDAQASHNTSKQEQLGYKYLLDIDGEVNAWSGLFWKLYSNSVVFKVKSHFEQWYYNRLKPWEHYIPVSGDLSDLQEKFEWAVAHDNECEQIASAGRVFACGLTYENELKATRFVNALGKVKRICKVSNLDDLESISDRSKVFIHSYQPECRTVTQPPGLGDFLRGSITLHQLAKRYGFILKLDFTDHPLARYFEQVDRIPKRGKLAVNEFFNQKNVELEPFVAACSSVRPTFIMTHAVPFKSVDDECRAFVRNRLQPKKEMTQCVDLLKQKLGLNRYCTVHLRMGDSQMDGQPAIPSIVSDWFRKRIIPVWGTEAVVISDNTHVKNELAREFGIKIVPDVKPVHLGECHTAGIPDHLIRDTLTEFMLMSQSQQIYRYSVYPWGSGFSDICSTIYQIPLAVMTEIPEETIIKADKEVTPVPERTVLNVGGNNKGIAIPVCYDGWKHVLLDIDPKGNPDVLCDARELWKLPPRQYDSIYCSHNLEHYYRHDAVKVLNGFRTVLKKDGFVIIKVPDILAVMQRVIDCDLDIDDLLYSVPETDVMVHDLIYGLHAKIERSGNEFYAHRTGFTAKSLGRLLELCGFKEVYVWESIYGHFELFAIAFLEVPNPGFLESLKEQLGLS